MEWALKYNRISIAARLRTARASAPDASCIGLRRAARTMTLRSLLTVIATFASIVFTPLTTAADELADIARLRREGQPAAALAKADHFLVAQPRDAQMRFARASLLVDLKRSSEAVAALESLTEDYPDLAEPYNNVAVLYAASGEFAKARSALEQALRLRPAYATAHENLGDVYAALAASAYASALRADPSLPGIQGKLAQVRQTVAPAAAASSLGSNPPAATPSR
ncbi:MAG: tetratricopeptide repeat protein [Caldimonas sp.]